MSTKKSDMEENLSDNPLLDALAAHKPPLVLSKMRILGMPKKAQDAFHATQDVGKNKPIDNKDIKHVDSDDVKIDVIGAYSRKVEKFNNGQ